MKENNDWKGGNGSEMSRNRGRNGFEMNSDQPVSLLSQDSKIVGHSNKPSGSYGLVNTMPPGYGEFSGNNSIVDPTHQFPGFIPGAQDKFCSALSQLLAAYYEKEGEVVTLRAQVAFLSREVERYRQNKSSISNNHSMTPVNYGSPAQNSYLPPAVAQHPATSSIPTTQASRLVVMIVALDYKGTVAPLNCVFDGERYYRLLNQCIVSEIDALRVYDNGTTKAYPTPEILRAKIAECGRRLKNPNDMFCFIFAGHGSQVKDKSGDEADGKDECFCLRQSVGSNHLKNWTDDEFQSAVEAGISPQYRIVIVTDCCHSGTITDVNNWQRHRAVAISGCMDTQCSMDLGVNKGGLLTNLLMGSVERMRRQGRTRYTVQDVFNEAWETRNEQLGFSGKEAVLKYRQKISLSSSPLVTPSTTPWPLILRP